MKKKSAGSVAIMLLVMIYLLIPLVISIIYSVFHKWTGVIPEGFTLHNYVDLNWQIRYRLRWTDSFLKRLRKYQPEE